MRRDGEADSRGLARQPAPDAEQGPEVTLYFWVIKVLCTTVGETASDYLTDNVGFGLTKTTFITGALLVVDARRSSSARARYVPVRSTGSGSC